MRFELFWGWFQYHSLQTVYAPKPVNIRAIPQCTGFPNIKPKSELSNLLEIRQCSYLRCYLDKTLWYILAEHARFHEANYY